MHFDNESHSQMQISLSLTTLTLNGGNFVFREQYARTTHSTALSADVIQNGCSAKKSCSRKLLEYFIPSETQRY